MAVSDAPGDASSSPSEESSTVSSLETLCDKLRSGIEVKDRRYHLLKYESCFVGKDAVSWLAANEHVSREDAVELGGLMEKAGLLQHVTKDHPFKDDDLFYRFAVDEVSHGKTGVNEAGSQLSWQQISASIWPTTDCSETTAGSLQSNLESVVSRDPDLDASLLHIGVTPLDEYNVQLLDNVHPAKWVDPEGTDPYNLVVLGAGSGGLVSAAGAAGVFAKVALVEDHLLGGDCLNVGCVPSKALIKAANVAHLVQNSSEYGVEIEGPVKVNFGKVMERMRRLRAGISGHDSANRFSKELGIDVFMGRGKFTGPNTLEVNGKTLNFKKAIIATGGTAALPPIPGLVTAPYLTNSSIFNLTELPPRLLVIGGGPIGLELAQAMQRFGSDVTILVRSDTILPKEDEDAAALVMEQLKKDGVKFKFVCKFLRVEHSASDGSFPSIRVVVGEEGKEGVEEVFEAEALLVATGRKPNVKDIGLEAAGVSFDLCAGVTVSDTLQTSNKAIFAVGDCCTKYQFTHVSDFMARIAIRNSLFFGKGKFSSLLIPWATYTEPEIAHVGLYPRDMQDRNVPFDTYTKEFKDVDRAIVEGETVGFVKVHVKKGTDQILGCTIAGANAGDMISEISVAMQNKVGLSKIAAVIHPYPTRADAVRQVGDLYNRTRLTPVVKGLFRNLMKVQR